MDLPRELVTKIVKQALEEDIGPGDITTNSLIPNEARCVGKFVMKQEGVLAGLSIAGEVFKLLDASARVTEVHRDGDRVGRGEVVMEVEAKAISILAGERVALNFLQRLSGIATLVARYVEAASGTRAKLVDTRKTTPGLRPLEKYAVRVGGARNHRMGLYDGVLIKENHLAVASKLGLGIKDAILKVRSRVPHTVKIEVEAENLQQVKEALDAGAEIILLDNMSLDEMCKAVQLVSGRAILEASGRVTLENIRAIAETGVDLISSGAITHSAPALDISLDIQPRNT